MIRHICKQMWNKRRANIWILLELILVTFFMWGAIDPVYVLLSNRSIDPGYDTDQVFRLSVGQYPSTHSKFDETQDSDSLRRIAFMRIYDRVRQYTGVESAVIIKDELYPLSQSMSSTEIKRDSLICGVTLMKFYRDGSFFDVFRIKDIYTGEIPDHRLPSDRVVYLTENGAERLYSEGNITGQEIYSPYGLEIFNSRGQDSTTYRVAGVMANCKTETTSQPRPVLYLRLGDFGARGFPHAAQVCFRIRDGISKGQFAEQFKKELAPQLSIGNLYFMTLTDFDTIRHHREIENGVLNKLRLQIGLAVFFLLCTFLGIAGTFWLRGNARRGEIGLRMSLGGSRKKIWNEFMLESWLLTTLACFIGILFVLQRVYYTGFAEAPMKVNDMYAQNRFVPHFLIVSAIVYALMLCIAFVGTWIPARQASSISPSEALRGE